MDRSPWLRRTPFALAVGAIVLGLCGAYLPGSSKNSTATVPTRPTAPAASPAPRDLGKPSGLPLPGTVSVVRFEEQLFAFLNERRYEALGWLRDKGVRDTGPYVDGQSFGTHPAVRVYYSPGVIRWLLNGRSGAIPDGEMIVKEHYAAPAIRHRGKSERELRDALESWTVMVKDSASAHDGWFWSNPSKGQRAGDPRREPMVYPVSGFGQACLRCHAATRSPGTEAGDASNEFTFASLRNIVGFPGAPLTFPSDDSWRRGTATKSVGAATRPEARLSVHLAAARPSSERLPSFLDLVAPVERAEVSILAPATRDWVVARRDRGPEFVTSNQCMSCHAGLVAPFGPTMFVPTGKSAEYGAPGWDVSPYGEWRWTPMGLAGRDPIVFAQIESELSMLRAEYEAKPAVARELGATLEETCLRCHGAMGKRQFDRDHPGGAARFSVEQAHAVADPAQPGSHGALARDGVGCVLCHRMTPRAQPADDRRPYLQFFLETSITGNFALGPPGEIYGPFPTDQIAPYAMHHATGFQPKQGAFLKSSQLCATCHTVVLPNVDRPLDPSDPKNRADELTASEVVPAFRAFHHHVEQATYLEWLNSEYENEINPDNPRARSCQDCHMARGLSDERHGLDIPQLRTKIAAIQDTTYPEAENLAPPDALRVRTRSEGFRRHNFAGLNVFLIEMFDQFEDVLGVPKTDYMTGSTQGIEHAVAQFVRSARDDVAALSVSADWSGPERLSARVEVTNKVGHRFPSGVGFRRAFLELAVIEQAATPGAADRIVWASGRTNELGVLIGADGLPLATEFFDRDPQTGRQQYQPHHDVIESPDQVQVYETLLKNAAGEFTTSFVRSCHTVKDNRLLPRGWKRNGPGPALAGRYLSATHPSPDAARDPRYGDGSGTDEVLYKINLPGAPDPARLIVRATLYYQAIPPYFLRNLFATAPDGPATRRLHYLCSRINLKGTPIEDWKLRIGTATSPVAPRP